MEFPLSVPEIKPDDAPGLPVLQDGTLQDFPGKSMHKTCDGLKMACPDKFLDVENMVCAQTKRLLGPRYSVMWFPEAFRYLWQKPVQVRSMFQL
ncbi:MAG: hypothetical protein M3O22_03505 [Pseudomonadota bacterium]|nr:hypothetical protein [Pseudomonadota bacterium]